MKIERDLNLIDQTLDHILSGLASVEPIRDSSIKKRLIETKGNQLYRLQDYNFIIQEPEGFKKYATMDAIDLEFFRIIPALEVSADGYFGLTEHEYNHVKSALIELESSDPDLANSIRESQAYNHARNRFSS